MRERLIELIGDALDDCGSMDCYKCSYELGNSCKAKMTADYLLDNGVIVPPCKPGDTVYEIYQFIYGAWVIDEHRVTLEDLPHIGETVFLTEEEAEAKLAELKGE